MELRALGRTGVRVSNLSLDAMAFGAMANSDHEECVRIIHTADMQSQGSPEEIVGKALKRRRDDAVLATKIVNPMGSDPNRRGKSRRWIVRACEEGLRPARHRQHRPLPGAPARRGDRSRRDAGALSDLMHEGKVRMVGSSTFPAEAVARLQEVACSPIPW